MLTSAPDLQLLAQGARDGQHWYVGNALSGCRRTAGTERSDANRKARPLARHRNGADACSSSLGLQAKSTNATAPSPLAGAAYVSRPELGHRSSAAAPASCACHTLSASLQSSEQMGTHSGTQEAHVSAFGAAGSAHPPLSAVKHAKFAGKGGGGLMQCIHLHTMQCSAGWLWFDARQASPCNSCQANALAYTPT